MFNTKGKAIEEEEEWNVLTTETSWEKNKNLFFETFFLTLKEQKYSCFFRSFILFSEPRNGLCYVAKTIWSIPVSCLFTSILEQHITRIRERVAGTLLGNPACVSTTTSRFLVLMFVFASLNPL